MNHVTSIYRHTNGTIALLTCDENDAAVSATVAGIEWNTTGRNGREVDTLIRSMGYEVFCNR